MSIFKRLFGGNKPTSTATKMSDEEAVDIIQQYGAVLGTGVAATGGVADVSLLPAEKQRVKQALQIGIKGSSDPSMKDHLKAAYLSLASFQDGVGNGGQGLDLSDLDLNSPVQELADQVLSKGDAFSKWSQVVQDEMQALEAELKHAGLA